MNNVGQPKGEKKVKEKESFKFFSHAFDPSPTHHNSPIQFKWPTRTWVGSRFLFFIIKTKYIYIYIYVVHVLDVIIDV